MPSETSEGVEICVIMFIIKYTRHTGWLQQWGARIIYRIQTFENEE